LAIDVSPANRHDTKGIVPMRQIRLVRHSLHAQALQNIAEQLPIDWPPRHPVNL
jgi:hypothetical protein